MKIMENSLTLPQQAILVETRLLEKTDQFDLIGLIFIYDNIFPHYRLTRVQAFLNDIQFLENEGYLDYWKSSLEVSLNKKGKDLAEELLKLPIFAPLPFG